MAMVLSHKTESLKTSSALHTFTHVHFLCSPQTWHVGDHILTFSTISPCKWQTIDSGGAYRYRHPPLEPSLVPTRTFLQQDTQMSAIASITLKLYFTCTFFRISFQPQFHRVLSFRFKRGSMYIKFKKIKQAWYWLLSCTPGGCWNQNRCS